MVFFATDIVIIAQVRLLYRLSLTLHWPLEKLIEGLKSPDTSSLMLPDLLSLSDPFSGSLEESAKGVCVSKCIPFICLFVFVSSKELRPKTEMFSCCGAQLNVIGSLGESVGCSVDSLYLRAAD